MNAKAARERNGDGSECDEVDSDSDGPVEPGLGLTRNEALQAAFVLRKYIKELDGPFVRELESMLDSFGKRIRVLEMQRMKDTKLTSYFEPK